MIDPLSDPRAADLLAAVPADVSTLASAFHTAAQEAAMTATGLLAAREDGTWTGHAADSFRDSIGQVPSELEHIKLGYSAVATALSDYEVTLALVQSEFVKVVGQLTDLSTQIGTAHTAATNAQNGMTPGHPMSFNDLRQAELAVAQARRALEGYHTEAHSLRSRAFTLLEEFDAARGLCRATVQAAQRTAPVRPQAGQGKRVTAPNGKLSEAGGRGLADDAGRRGGRDGAVARGAQAHRGDDPGRPTVCSARPTSMAAGTGPAAAWTALASCRRSCGPAVFSTARSRPRALPASRGSRRAPAGT